MRYGALYAGVEYFNKQALNYVVYFGIRRLIFAIIIVFCSKSIVLQVLLLDYSSLIMTSWAVKTKPMRGSFHNILFIMNELIVMLSIFLIMVLFSDFVTSPDLKYTYGYYYLALFGIETVLNASLIVWIQIKEVQEALRLRKLRN